MLFQIQIINIKLCHQLTKTDPLK